MLKNITDRHLLHVHDSCSRNIYRRIEQSLCHRLHGYIIFLHSTIMNTKQYHDRASLYPQHAMQPCSLKRTLTTFDPFKQALAVTHGQASKAR